MLQNADPINDHMTAQETKELIKEENIYPEDEITEDDLESETITLEDKIRNSFFIILCLEYAVSSMDGGIVPQQNSKIQEDFQGKDDFRVGLFSSIDYIGRIIGAIVMSFLMDKISRKIFFSGCCVIKALFLMLSIFTPNFIINLITRLLSGIPQTLLTSYGVVWTVQFAKRKYRTLMLPIAQFAALVGIILGYGLALLCQKIIPKNSKMHSWRISFFIEGILLIIFGVIFYLYPDLYFSSTFYLNENDDYKGKEKSLKEIINEKSKGKKENFCTQLPKILCTKLFLFASIANTVSFFGMRVIQFYVDKYMEFVLDVNSEKRFMCFVILCITGPSTGAILGGIICSKIGGYASKNGMWMMLILTIIASISSTLLTISNNTFFFSVICWIYFFCLAAVTPLAGGLIISALPNDLKGSGYSVNMFFLNGIGSFPGPAIYSLIADLIKNNKKDNDYSYLKKAMEITMYYNYVGMVLMIIASVLRFRIKGDLGDDKKKEDDKDVEPLGEIDNESDKK